MKPEEQRRVVEALVMSSPEPISAARLAEIVPGCSPGEAKDLVNQLNTEYQEQDRAFEIWEVAGGFQLRTRAEFSGYLHQLQKQRPLRLSRAALETLSIVAYKQPATRAEIEQVRGVEAGPVLRSLLDRQLVKITGHKEVPGRPMLYGTTRRFLEVFGMKNVKDLPALRELEELARESGIGIVEEAADEVEDAGGDVEAGEGEDTGDEDGIEIEAIAPEDDAEEPRPD
jgi:segregation and condensation protein B